jgi:spermidine/putrescine transport system permease protein
MRLRIPRGAIPYLLLVPGIGWLLLFYVYPALQLFLVSLWTGNVTDGYEMTYNFGIYSEALSEYWPWIVRSAGYGGLATILAFLLAYPLAYTIAFKGGRYKNLLLFLVIAPFFTSFLLRTISWKIILADSGIVLGPLKDVGLLADDFRILATPAAVIAGITYNLLPFMTLPLYVALEKVDVRLLEAARDLYAGPWRPGGTIVGAIFAGAIAAVAALVLGADPLIPALAAAAVGAVVGTFLIGEAFVRITFPMSLPGVFAGSLLTFIPAVGDFINAELLGNPRSQMIGNVIQGRFLEISDYPMASALSFILMAAIIIGVLLYARVLGTEELTGGRA